ncbi:MAG: hypothetical protein N3I35_12590, partial [Clostridia bacterium]|nr:hypothetical protein [Clostridia bacterium]
MLNIDLGELAKSLNGLNISEVEETDTGDIGIIGISVKLPLAGSTNEFWEALKAGRDCISDYPQGRSQELDLYFRFKGKDTRQVKYKKGAYLERIDEFDCRFFNISPREASLMDPN